MIGKCINVSHIIKEVILLLIDASCHKNLRHSLFSFVELSGWVSHSSLHLQRICNSFSFWYRKLVVFHCMSLNVIMIDYHKTPKRILKSQMKIILNLLYSYSCLFSIWFFCNLDIELSGELNFEVKIILQTCKILISCSTATCLVHFVCGWTWTSLALVTTNNRYG